MRDLAALRLQVEWGADEALVPMPLDRMRHRPETPALSAAAKPARSRAPASASVPSGSAAEQAQRAAAAATSLTELRAAIADFGGCPLRDTATNAVLAEGPDTARLLLVSDTPESEDDRAGRPLAGAAGDYLDRMLASIGLARETLLLVPLLPYRPPGGRPPSERELATWMPFLHRYVELSFASFAVLLGGGPVRALLGRLNARGRRGWRPLQLLGLSRSVQALPMQAPSEVQRKSSLRAGAWADLRLLRRTLDRIG